MSFVQDHPHFVFIFDARVMILVYFSQVDLRHRQVSKSVEDVQKMIKVLTAEVSSKDARFQSIANSGVHNDSFKVTHLLFSLMCMKSLTIAIVHCSLFMSSLGPACFSVKMGCITPGQVYIQSHHSGKNVNCVILM